jgi:hypothetical protein
MPGGVIAIAIDDDYFITMTGPVTRVADGILYDEMFESLEDQDFEESAGQ